MIPVVAFYFNIFSDGPRLYAGQQIGGAQTVAIGAHRRSLVEAVIAHCRSDQPAWGNCGIIVASHTNACQ